MLLAYCINLLRLFIWLLVLKNYCLDYKYLWSGPQPSIQLGHPVQPMGQLRGEIAGGGPPLPVLPGGGGGVDAPLAAQAQHVLHLHDGVPGGAGPDAPHHAPVLPLFRGEVQVGPGGGHIVGVGGADPAQGSVVVVGDRKSVV